MARNDLLSNKNTHLKNKKIARLLLTCSDVPPPTTKKDNHHQSHNKKIPGS